MYLLALIVLIITGLVSATDILFDIKEFGEGTTWLVKISQMFFWLSLLFFVFKMPTKKK
ncbi:hypothetical protein [Paenibacillus pabuli]|uniref:hypothetical protein n=1 Tax=Paenibacillus pabuli TaxID=1472 RepID=UPI000AD69DBB|nr:hypothetical protein [Paenibacillus pabuli]MEC0124160.1 hypothetical protein [Paenibacillus pabuli]